MPMSAESVAERELAIALDFAVAREREAEAFYKAWAARIPDPRVHALFAELVGAEHGHGEVLSRITPREMLPARRESAAIDVSDLLVESRTGEPKSVREAMDVAMQRATTAIALYERLATLGGEAGALLAALAREERSQRRRIELEYLST